MVGDDPKSVLITGASSGIGRALALSYAAPGVTLFVTGRDAARTDAVAAECRARGAAAEAKVIDVAEADAMATWIQEIDQRAPLDLVVANAGVSGSTSGETEPAARTRRIFSVNVDGVVNTVLPALAAMDARGRGRIAIMASVAGFHGLPWSAAYAASKAAVKSWGEGLRVERLDTGVRVNVICPGWVVSRLTDANKYTMPMIMPAERAAAIIRRGLAKDRPRIVFPWRMYLGVWLLATLPPSWTDRVLNRVMGKREI